MEWNKSFTELSGISFMLIEEMEEFYTICGLVVLLIFNIFLLVYLCVCVSV